MSGKERIDNSVLGCAALAVAWWVAARIGGPIAGISGAVPAMWLPTGVALAVVVRHGERLLPGVLAGALVAGATAQDPIHVIVIGALASALEVLVGARVLRAVGQFDPDLGDVRSVLALVAVAAPAMGIVGASGAVLCLGFAGAAPIADLPPLWGMWWLGDVIGIAAAGPLVFTWLRRGRGQPVPGTLVELAVLLAGLVAVTTVAFGEALPHGDTAYPLAFVVAPFLLWSAVRHGPRGAASACFIASAGAAISTALGHGPLVHLDPRASLVLLQSFIAITVLSSLVLAGALTSTRTMARALAASEFRERALLSGIPDLIFRVSPDGRILEQHGRAAASTVPDMTGRRIEELVPTESALIIRDRIANAAVRGTTEVAEVRGTPETGSRHWEARFVPMRDGSVLTLVRDISVRRVAEAAVRESEERYRTLFQENPAPILIMDADTFSFLDVNETAVHQYGWSRDEFRTLSASDIRPPEDRGAFEAVARSVKDMPFTSSRPWRHCRKDGSVFEVDIVSHPVRINGRVARIIIVNDISERTRLEGQLREAQKMEAIGRLVGGIAHDFNNLLTAVVGYSELLLDTVPESDPVHADVREILAAGLRGTQLTRQLLAFSRQQVLAPRVVDLNHVLERSESMFRHILGDRIRLDLDLCEETPRVKADPGQLEQILTNLVTNARDAMPKGGALTVTTRIVDIHAGAAAANIEAAPGAYAVLSLADTGVGMDQETRRHMFEPFFTTKPLGQATGLGLSAVYGFVVQTGGFVDVASAPGDGTTVSLHLPRLETDLPSGVLVQPSHLPFAGCETVLCVEDEPSVRRLIRRALSDRGYTVIVAGGGPEALRMAEAHKGEIHALVVDVVILHSIAPDVVTQLRQTRSGVPVLYVTGYETGVGSRSGKPDAPVLQKPFSPEQLARGVRELLDERKGR